jgi:hypothetical protein
MEGARGNAQSYKSIDHRIISTQHIMSKSKKPAETGWTGLLHERLMNINDSKIFAGLMIITLNIASKFATLKLGKTTEMYLKYTFSKQILVFAIAWMGTRDIYIALGLTIIFIVLFDFLLNDESQFCILPQDFKEFYDNIDTEISHDEYIKAKTVIDKYVEQKEASTENKSSKKSQAITEQPFSVNH